MEAAVAAVTANDPICRMTWMIRAVRMRSPDEAITPCGRRPVISRLERLRAFAVGFMRELGVAELGIG